MNGLVSRETGSVGAPPAPDEARRVFAGRCALAGRYAELLATEATTRGLIGPREIPRLWDRHLLNCALVADLIPSGAWVADVGSGAGLPGLALAIRRPDLRVTLVEPLQRRCVFLAEAVRELGLVDVEVRRARAEELDPAPAFDVVTSRAVSALARLLPLTMPLVRPGGVNLAVKGSSAHAELEAARPALRRCGGRDAEVLRLGENVVTTPTTVVRVHKREAGAGRTGPREDRGGR